MNWSPQKSFEQPGRVLLPGFVPASAPRTYPVAPGGALCLPVSAGTLIGFEPLEGSLRLAVTSVDSDGRASCESLGLGGLPQAPVDPRSFRSQNLADQVRGFGLSLSSLGFARIESAQTRDGAIVLKAAADCTLVVCAPVDPLEAIDGGMTEAHGGRIKVTPPTDAEPALPLPLGETRDEFLVRRGTARAYELSPGEMVQIIDIEGRQCSDFMAMSSAALEAGRECALDSTVSRSLAGGAYPLPGLFDKFFDQDINPMLAVVQDTVGRHDTFGWACTAKGYEDRGFPGHVNCSDNISAAFDPYGIRNRPAWPAINFFFNAWILPSDNRTRSDEGWSRPGDYVLMRALDELVCVTTSCPDEIDPINGWNPTDVYVRIYRPDTRARRAVAYRAQPDAEAVLTQESPFHERTSALTRNFAVARDLWMPTVYDATGTLEEYWACRNAATVQDMSPLRKLDICGPDAERLLQLALSRDVGKVALNRGTYALLCDRRGSVVDDGTLFRMGAGIFRWCCGSDDSASHLSELAAEHKLSVWVRDMSQGLCNLAVQGPKSRDLLSSIVFTRDAQPSLANLKWFGYAIGRLHDGKGRPFMISRTGYTGELGYEIFCAPADATEIWDAVLAAGEPHGLVPQGGHALELIRVEAGLMAAGAEFGDGIDPDEAGLGFAVDMKKADFVGKSAIERNRAAPRRQLVGLLLEGEEVPVHGDGVFEGRRQVGVVTSAVRSPTLDRPIAMARIAVEDAATDNLLEVGKLDGHMKRLPARVTTVPFVDPTRARARQ